MTRFFNTAKESDIAGCRNFHFLTGSFTIKRRNPLAVIAGNDLRVVPQEEMKQ